MAYAFNTKVNHSLPNLNSERRCLACVSIPDQPQIGEHTFISYAKDSKG